MTTDAVPMPPAGAMWCPNCNGNTPERDSGEQHCLVCGGDGTVDASSGREVVSWLPAELPAVTADPDRHSLDDRLHAHAAWTALERTAKAFAGDVKASLERDADEVRAVQGGEWRHKASGAVSVAYDTFHDRTVAVVDHEGLYAWLADVYGDDVASGCSVVRYDWTVEPDLWNDAVDLLRRIAPVDGSDAFDMITDAINRLEASVTKGRSVTVDSAALLAATDVHSGEPLFVVASDGAGGERLITTDGEVVPHVTVTARRFRNVTVKPDGKHVTGLRALMRRAVLRDTDQDDR